MSRRLLVNDALSQLGERTFWHDLLEWFGCELVEGDYSELADKANLAATGADLIIRNGTRFGPIAASERIPTLSLIQDILTEGEIRKQQDKVILGSKAVIFNSEFTLSHYRPANGRTIPLPVDFGIFEPGNPMGLQQALSLPDGCVCWVGASEGAAGHVKGWDVFLSVVRANPDLTFVAVFKDSAPAYGPPNLRTFARLPQARLAEVIGACRVGLCTSRIESQHLAGIEMGACGLPLVAPPVGAYWKRGDLPGVLVDKLEVGTLISAIRAARSNPSDPQTIRAYWQREFDKPIVRTAWTALVEEIECSGRS